MTAYERHEKLGHKTVDHSPDGFVKIEECTECLYRALHSPAFGYPVSMEPTPRYIAMREAAAKK